MYSSLFIAKLDRCTVFTATTVAIYYFIDKVAKGLAP